MGAIHFSLDPHLIQSLRSALPLPIFLETGTFQGDTAAAVAASFDRVFTVELSDVLFARASARLAPLTNVSPRHGSSPQVIQELSPQLCDQSVLYWLDAHWCGAETAGKLQECPLLPELRAIGTLNDESVILIDDARYFLGPPPAPHDADQWPQLDEVLDELRRLNPHHRLWVISDVLIFAPPSVRGAIVDYGRRPGTDLLELARAASTARAGSRTPSAPVGGATAGNGTAGNGTAGGARLDAAAFATQRAERLFSHHLQRLQITRVLHVGSHTEQFAATLRHCGFGRAIYSIERPAAGYAQLLARSREDPQWFPLAQAGSGADAPLMSPSDRLLRAPMMAAMQALKIDEPGHEDEVIEGCLAHMPGVRLLLVRLPRADQPGAADWLELDAKLVKQRGFSRVALEPCLYDEASGVVQQYEALYQRPDRAGPVPVPSAGSRVGAVVTSVGGQPERLLPDGSDLGPQWLQTCVDAWRRTGAPVISVSEQRPPAAIHWVRTETRPSVARMLAEMPPATAGHLLLTNADIALAPTFFQILGKLDPEAVYYGNRVDVERRADPPGGLRAVGLCTLGFDYFLLPPEFVTMAVAEQLMPRELAIGEPWWDLVLPLLAIARGFPLKRLPWTAPLAFHYVHPARRSQNLWLRNGQICIQLIERLLREPDCHGTGALSRMLSGAAQPGAELQHIAGIIGQSLP